MKWRFQLAETAGLEFNLIPVVLFTAIFSVVMGGLLRFPQLVIEIKENKKWTFDWPKFIAVRLPTLLILILYIYSYTGMKPAIHLIIIGDPTLATFAGIVFGYTLLEGKKNTNS